MKKDLSVLSFSANRTFFWIVLYLAAFSVSQLYLFDLRLNDPEYAADPWVVFNSWFALSIGMALIILSGIPSKGSRYEYRLRLLRISERRYFMLSTLYNTAVFILVWLTESAVLSIAVRIYERSASFTDGPQGIFARLGSSPFLQRFILLDDVGIFI